MRLSSERLTFSASDLAGHLACRHLTDLDRRAARGELQRPIWTDPTLELLKERGIEFEDAFVERLRSEGRQMVELREVEGESALERWRGALFLETRVVADGSEHCRLPP